MPDTLTREQFAASIKAKYPVYAGVPNSELVDKMLAKYPAYQDRIVDIKSAAESPGSGLSDFVLGTSGKPSVAGFLGNAVTSGVNFAGNVAAPLLHPVDTVQGLAAAVREPTLTGKLIRDAVMKRYGSVDAFLNTLYTDPVGAASDASMVAGTAGLAAKAGGFGKAANYLSQASDVLNPMSIPARAAESLGKAAYGAAINPSRANRRQFPEAVKAGYEANVLPTESGLNRTEGLLQASATHTDAQLARADAAHAPRVTASQITPAFNEPIAKAQLRLKGGLPSEVTDLAARQATTAKQLQFGQSLSNANDIKREMQGVAEAAFRAQGRGALIKDLDALASKNVAQAYRRAIEVNAASVGITDIAASNQKTQALIGLTRALEDATQQPTRLSHLLATLEGVAGAMGGGIGSGAGAYAATRIATSKPVMAGAGLAVGKSSKVLRNAQIMRALAVLSASPDGKGTAEQQ